MTDISHVSQQPQAPLLRDAFNADIADMMLWQHERVFGFKPTGLLPLSKGDSGFHIGFLTGCPSGLGGHI